MLNVSQAISKGLSTLHHLAALMMLCPEEARLLQPKLLAFSSVKNHTKSRKVRVRQEEYNRENERGEIKTKQQNKQKENQKKNRINRV